MICEHIETYTCRCIYIYIHICERISVSICMCTYGQVEHMPELAFHLPEPSARRGKLAAWRPSSKFSQRVPGTLPVNAHGRMYMYICI